MATSPGSVSMSAAGALDDTPDSEPAAVPAASGSGSADGKVGPSPEEEDEDEEFDEEEDDEVDSTSSANAGLCGAKEPIPPEYAMQLLLNKREEFIWWQLIPPPAYIEEGPNTGWSVGFLTVIPSSSGAGHPPKVRFGRVEHKVLWDWEAFDPAFQKKLDKVSKAFIPGLSSLWKGGKHHAGCRSRYKIDQDTQPYTVTLQAGASFGNHKTVLSLRREVARSFGIAEADQKFTAVREDLSMNDAALLPVYYDRVIDYFGPAAAEDAVHYCADSFVTSDKTDGVRFLGKQDNILVRLNPGSSKADNTEDTDTATDAEVCEMALNYDEMEADTIHQGSVYVVTDYFRGVVRLAEESDPSGPTTRVRNTNNSKLMVPNHVQHFGIRPERSEGGPDSVRVSVRNEDAYAANLNPAQKLPLAELIIVGLGAFLLLYVYTLVTTFVNNYVANWRDADMKKPGNNGMMFGKLSNCSAVELTNKMKPITNFIIIGGIAFVVLCVQIVASIISMFGKNIVGNLVGFFCKCCCRKRVRQAGKTCCEWLTCGCIGKAGYGRPVIVYTNLAVQAGLVVVAVFIMIYFISSMALDSAFGTLITNLIDGTGIIIYHLKSLLDAVFWLLAWAQGNKFMAPMVAKLPALPNVNIEALIDQAMAMGRTGKSLGLAGITGKTFLLAIFLQVILMALACAIVGANKRSRCLLNTTTFAILLCLFILCLQHSLFHQPFLLVLQTTCNELNETSVSACPKLKDDAPPMLFEFFSKCQGIDGMMPSMDFAEGYLNQGVSQLNALLPGGAAINTTIDVSGSFAAAKGLKPPTSAPAAPSGLPGGMHRRLLGMSMPPGAAGKTGKASSAAAANKEKAGKVPSPPSDIAADNIQGQAGAIGSQAGALAAASSPGGMAAAAAGAAGSARGTLGGVASMFAQMGADALQEIRDMLAAIQVMVTLVKTIIGLAKCNTIEKVVYQLASDVCSNEPAQLGISASLALVVVNETYVIYALILAWLCISLLVFVLSKPKKPWKCQVCGDHFRFKIALQAHRKVTCKDGLATLTMPISYNALNSGQSTVIPSLKQALRADLTSQIISIATDMGYPEYQQKRRSAYGGLEGIDPSNIVLSLDPRFQYDLDGPVRVDFRIKIPMKKEKPSNRKDVMEILQDKDGKGCCGGGGGQNKVEMSEEAQKEADDDAEKGLVAPPEQVSTKQAAFSETLEGTIIPFVAVFEDADDTEPRVLVNGSEFTVQWVEGYKPTFEMSREKVLSAGDTFFFRERGTLERNTRYIQAFADGPIYEVKNESGRDKDFVRANQEFTVARIEENKVFVFVDGSSGGGGGGGGGEEMHWSFSNPFRVFTVFKMQPGLGGVVQLRAKGERVCKAAFYNPHPWCQTAELFEKYPDLLTSCDKKGVEPGDAVEWTPKCCSFCRPSCRSCCGAMFFWTPCYWKTHGTVSFVGLYQEDELFKPKVDLAGWKLVQSVTGDSKAVSKAAKVEPEEEDGENDSVVERHIDPREEFRKTIPVMPELSSAGELFQENAFFRFGQSPSNLSEQEMAVAERVKGGASRMYNRSLKRNMVRDGRDAVERTVGHFLRQLEQEGDITGWVGLSRTHKVGAAFGKDSRGSALSIDMSANPSAPMVKHNSTSYAVKWTKVVDREIEGTLRIAKVDPGIGGLVKLEDPEDPDNFFSFKNPTNEERVFAMHFAREEPVSNDTHNPMYLNELDIKSLYAPEKARKSKAARAAAATAAAAGRVVQAMDDMLCDCIPNVEEDEEKDAVEILVDTFRNQQRRPVITTTVTAEEGAGGEAVQLNTGHTLIGYSTMPQGSEIKVRAMPIRKEDNGQAIMVSEMEEVRDVSDYLRTNAKDAAETVNAADHIIDLLTKTKIRVANSAIDFEATIRRIHMDEEGSRNEELVPPGSKLVLTDKQDDIVPNGFGTGGTFKAYMVEGPDATTGDFLEDFIYVVARPFHEEIMKFVSIGGDGMSIVVTRQPEVNPLLNFETLHAAFLTDKKPTPGDPVPVQTRDTLELAFKTFVGPLFNHQRHAIVTLRDSVSIEMDKLADDGMTGVVTVHRPVFTNALMFDGLEANISTDNTCVDGHEVQWVQKGKLFESEEQMKPTYNNVNVIPGMTVDLSDGSSFLNIFTTVSYKVKFLAGQHLRGIPEYLLSSLKFRGVRASKPSRPLLSKSNVGDSIAFNFHPGGPENSCMLTHRMVDRPVFVKDVASVGDAGCTGVIQSVDDSIYGEVVMVKDDADKGKVVFHNPTPSHNTCMFVLELPLPVCKLADVNIKSVEILPNGKILIEDKEVRVNWTTDVGDATSGLTITAMKEHINGGLVGGVVTLSDGSKFKNPTQRTIMLYDMQEIEETNSAPLKGGVDIRFESKSFSSKDVEVNKKALVDATMIEFVDASHVVFSDSLTTLDDDGKLLFGAPAYVVQTFTPPRVHFAGHDYKVDWIGSPSSSSPGDKLVLTSVEGTVGGVVQLSDGSSFQNPPFCIRPPEVKWVKGREPAIVRFEMLCMDLAAVEEGPAKSSSKISFGLGSTAQNRAATVQMINAGARADDLSAFKLLWAGPSGEAAGVLNVMYEIAWSESDLATLQSVANPFSVLPIKLGEDKKSVIVTTPSGDITGVVPVSVEILDVLAVHSINGSPLCKVELSDGSQFVNPDPKRQMFKSEFVLKASVRLPVFTPDLAGTLAVVGVDAGQGDLAAINWLGQQFSVEWVEPPPLVLLGGNFTIKEVEDAQMDVRTGEKTWTKDLTVTLVDGNDSTCTFINPHIAALSRDEAMHIFEEADEDGGGSLGLDEWLDRSQDMKELVTTTNAGISMRGFENVAGGFSSVPFTVVGGEETIAVYRVTSRARFCVRWCPCVVKCPGCCKGLIHSSRKSFDKLVIAFYGARDSVALIFCFLLLLLLPQGVLLYTKTNINTKESFDAELSVFIAFAGLTGFYGTSDRYGDGDKLLSLFMSIVLLLVCAHKTFYYLSAMQRELSNPPCGKGFTPSPTSLMANPVFAEEWFTSIGYILACCVGLVLFSRACCSGKIKNLIQGVGSTVAMLAMFITTFYIVGDLMSTLGSGSVSFGAPPEGSLCPMDVLVNKMSMFVFMIILMVHMLLTFSLVPIYCLIFSSLMSDDNRRVITEMGDTNVQNRKRLARFKAKVARSHRSDATGAAALKNVLMDTFCNIKHIREETIPYVRLLLILVVSAIAAGLVCTWIDRGAYRTVPQSCNGFAHLCGERYNNVFYATSHNAMSTVDDHSAINGGGGFVGPYQFETVSRQLQLGARALNFDGAQDGINGSAVSLCTEMGCQYGHLALEVAAAEVRKFIDWDQTRRRVNVDAPAGGEVITLLIQGKANADDLQKAFELGGLFELVYDPSDARFSNTAANNPADAKSISYPTLGDLLCSPDYVQNPDINCTSSAVVVFVETVTGGARPAWALPMSDAIWQTSPDIKENATLLGETCSRDSGPAEASLAMRNFFMSEGGASPAQAVAIQYNPELLGYVFECYDKTKELPNFFNVDFITTGDVLQLSGILNERRNKTAEAFMASIQAEFDFMWNPRLSGICNTTERDTKCWQIDKDDPDFIFTHPQMILFVVWILQAALVFVPCFYGCCVRARKRSIAKRKKQSEEIEDDDSDDGHGQPALTVLSDNSAGGLAAAANAKDDGNREKALDLDDQEDNLSEDSRLVQEEIEMIEKAEATGLIV